MDQCPASTATYHDLWNRNRDFSYLDSLKQLLGRQLPMQTVVGPGSLEFVANRHRRLLLTSARQIADRQAVRIVIVGTSSR